jgi:glutaredoxin 3
MPENWLPVFTGNGTVIRVAVNAWVLPLVFFSMKTEKIRLFIKPYCGWCHEAQDWLDARGIQYDVLDVIADAHARREMFQLSGQTLAPVIDVDGEVLADFDTDQLEVFWQKLEQTHG